ncbi:MAG TPA: hypothetical protein ENH84_06695 [Phycisphaerae bacterium]|nr:hypothetical protein [Phycisphaerae bacterium]
MSEIKDKGSRCSVRMKRPRLRRLLRIIVCSFVLLVGVFFLARYWLLPAVVELKVNDFLDTYWDGQAEIGKVEISFSGPLVLRNVSLRGPSGRQWIRAESITLRLRDWPSFHPVLCAIEIRRPVGTVFVDRGTLNLPLRRPMEHQRRKSGSSAYVDIQTVNVVDASIRMVDQTAPIDAPENPEPILTSLRHIRFQGTAAAEGSMVITLGEKTDIKARFDARVNLSYLRISDLRRLFGMEPIKDVSLEPLEFSHFRIGSVTYRDGLLDVSGVSAETCEGVVWGDARIDIRPDRPLRYKVDAMVKNVRLPVFYAAFDPTQNVRFGRARGLVNIDGTGTELEGMDLEGFFFLDDSDLDETNSIGSIFNFLQIPGQKIKGGSDFRALFRIQKGILTFAQGRLGNNLTALLIESGGTADLRTRQLDLFVVAGRLKKLQRVPLLGIFASMEKNLTRLHVFGDWRQPVILKRPIYDLAQGTKDFFRDVLRMGGELDDPLTEQSR